jgi:hypothetical protein
VHDVAARSHADLPLVQERAPSPGADGRIHINVVEYDEGVIAR